MKRDPWDDLATSVGFYTSSTSRRIPEMPGIYAWFLPLWLYRTDLEQLLQTVLGVFRYDAKSKGVASTENMHRLTWEEWRVGLKREFAVKCPPAITDQWNSAMQNDAAKVLLQALLLRASIFVPPLYVGKTKNLRDRYRSHVTNDSVEKNTFHRRFEAFREEIPIEIGISDLLFVTCPIRLDDENELEKLALQDLLEFLLLRLCRPVFSEC
jgi:hypothetical protein